jgi:outer membrane protein assembly factor BamB
MTGVRRTALVTVAALVTVLLLGLLGYRVLAPRDTVHLAQGRYPKLPVVQQARVFGLLLRTPLLVDGRLRIYASVREVWADQPATTKSSLTPYWSLRRWPAQLQAVAAVDTTVLSLWSDGRLYATDAHTGQRLWSVGTGVTGGYTGRRTGAQTVYAPPHLTTSGNTVIVGGTPDAPVTAVDVVTGAKRWQQPACPTEVYTVGGVIVCPAKPARLLRVADGSAVSWPVDPAQLTPFGCGPARSACQGVRGNGRAWLVGPDDMLTEQPALADPNSWLAGDVVVTSHLDGTVTGTSLATGARLWSWVDQAAPPTPRYYPAPSPGTGAARDLTGGPVIVGQQAGVIHIYTPAIELVSLDPTDGSQVSRINLVPDDPRPFKPGYVYAGGGLVFMERLFLGSQPGYPDTARYFHNPGVLAVGVVPHRA